MKVEVNILISILSGASGGGLLYLLLKTYLTEKIKGQIKYDYDLKLESALTEIKHEYDIKFETARKDLEKKATEHQIQYSKLHIERSEKLREIYEKLIYTEGALEHFTHMGQGPEWSTDTTRETNAWREHEELISLIKKRRIYFPEELCKKLDSFCDEYKDVIVQMSVAKDRTRMGLRGNNEAGSPIRTWMVQRDRVKGEIVKTRGLIENEFRKLLGT